MALVDHWNEIEQGLDPRWKDARLLLTVDDESHAERALALLGPAGPGRSGREIRFYTERTGSIGPEAIRRMLRRIDAEGVEGTLTLVSTDDAPPEPVVSRPTLAAKWDAVAATLPADWSDLLCELELTSSDHVDQAALLISPVNPFQSVESGKPGFRFRVARTFGYGASPGMVRRCLTRLDDAGIPGEVRVMRALSDTHPVGTQGPVWMIGGKTV